MSIPHATRSKLISFALVPSLAVLALVLRRPILAWFSGESTGTAGPSVTSAARGMPGEVDHYTCSMHPSVKQAAPGKCPICGMGLIAVTKEQQSEGAVTIDDARRRLIGVRTAPVTVGPMRKDFRAVGHVTYDESSLTDVNLKVHGWITKLYVSETGQRVTRGQTLLSLYSPELYNAEQDFILAAQSAATPSVAPGAGPNRVGSMAGASRQRLRLLGLDEGQIEALAKQGAAPESVPISAPASGFVIEKNVVEGASVDAGMRLYRIAALTKVWIEAQVYEADIEHVRAGQSASVTLDYLPGRTYEAKVAYVYPYLDPQTRTGQVRLELANEDLDLRPGMYASVTLGADLGEQVQVPSPAVVYTGPRRLVFVDLGQGRFRPEEVSLGAESNGMYEVLSGLTPGDQVATSGVFLIAAEARIRTASKYWDSPDSPADAAANAVARPEPVSVPTVGAAPTHEPMPKRGVP
jgi:Cu(I)/Ag(I) efflux system membrane fusion protein